MSQSPSDARRRALRARVDRLLVGDFSTDDFATLLLWLRDKSFGNAVVRELGDFVAHADVRNKGLMTDAVREFFVVLRHKMPLLAQGQMLTPEDLPASFIPAVRANFRLSDSVDLHRELGLKPKAVKNLLEAALAKLHPHSTGRVRLVEKLTQDEARVLLHLERLIIAKPVFTEVNIIGGLGFALQKNGLLRADETKQLKEASIPLTLYAATVMHQCEVDLGDGTSAFLQAGINKKGGSYTLGVSATASVPVPGDQDLVVGGPILDTDFPVGDWCDGTLPVTTEKWSSATWECGIELGPNRKLREL